MKRILSMTAIVVLSSFYLVNPLSYPQEANPQVYEIKSVDINNDNKPDVTYYHNQKYVVKAEADTNNDGKPDIVVQAENGKFKSAQVDTNYDGMPDKNFSNYDEFNKWLNDTHPEYKKALGWQDWSYTPFKF